MTTGHKITAGLAVALAVLMGWAAYGWAKEHEAHAVLAAQQKDAQATQTAIDAKEKDNQAQLAATLSSLEKQRVIVQTPQQVVQALPAIMDAMPAPVTQVTTQQAQAAASLPDAPKVGVGDIIIPAADAKPFYDSEVTCKENAAKAASCEETEANDQALLASKDALIKDQATALKGGTMWHRVLTAAKWVAIGGAAGIVIDRTIH